MSAPVVRAEDLVRRFADRTVIAGVSLAIEAGERVALLGPSGSGKTTLLQMIGLLDRPDAGRVFLGGTDAWALPPSGRARLRLEGIGFVFQQHNLFPYLSALENVAIPAWRLGGSRRRALDRAAELLARVGLAARASSRAAVLSTGEQQRVALARALVNRPRLVLADEPTGSLDSQSAEAVLDALDLASQQGAALLIVTHNLEVAERASRVVSMRDGAITQVSAARQPAGAP